MVANMFKALLVLTFVLAAGCGGSSETPNGSVTDAIKEQQRAFLKAVQADDAGAMCRLTTDQEACLAEFATMRAFGLKPSDRLTGDDAQRIDAMTVTVEGDRAKTSGGSSYIKTDGKWLLVLKPVD
jgi:hypothetical protein